MWRGGRVVMEPDLRATSRGFESRPPRCRVQPWASLHTWSASVNKQYNLIPANGRWCSAAWEVTVGLAESILTAYRRVYGFPHLWADCRGPGSAPESHARFEYGTTWLNERWVSRISDVVGAVGLSGCDKSAGTQRRRRRHSQSRWQRSFWIMQRRAGNHQVETRKRARQGRLRHGRSPSFAQLSHKWLCSTAMYNISSPSNYDFNKYYCCCYHHHHHHHHHYTTTTRLVFLGQGSEGYEIEWP